MRRLAAILARALVSLAVASCAGAGAAASKPVDLTVAGAASLRDALTEAADRYERLHHDVRIRLTFDASSALRAQIEQGAPVDVFASADTTNPQQLVDHGLATRPFLPIARNRLVIVVPHTTRPVVATPLDLAGPGLKVVAAGADVPITKYADELVGRLTGEPGYPPDYANRVAANVVSREENVRAIVAKVALGEGDAGIVYATDATGANVATVEIPPSANVIATYGAVVTSGARDPAAARAFLDWLVGRDGQAVLAGFGFLPSSG
jgi:molybdate transport system substrate-binding protein